MIATDDVTIKWRTPGVIAGSVRDFAGVHDVTWSGSTGWCCSCAEPGPCAHVLAVRQTTEAVA